MTRENEVAAHQKRFARWQSRAPEPTRVLSELIQSRIAPFFEAKDFQRVGVALGRADEPVDGNEIRLERASGTQIDTVTAWFDKHHRPRFQIDCSRRQQSAPNEFIRSAKLTARSSQYFHFWGKPIYVPQFLWSAESATREVEAITRKLDQVLTFLETGQRGPNIGIPFENPSLSGSR